MKIAAAHRIQTRGLARITMMAAAGLLLSATVVSAALPARFGKTPTAKDFPNADVVVLSEHTAFTLLPDGRVRKRVEKIEKILTYHGMDVIGDPKVAFNTSDQDLKIEIYRSYTPDGRVVDAEANSFTEMTPFQLQKAPAYTSRRQMVMTKVGLDLNAVTETAFTLSDTKPWRRFLEGVEVLAGPEPALERVISITVPEDTDLHYELFNAEAEPRISKKDGNATYTWTLTNVPLIPSRERGELEDDFLPTLVFTTCPNWGHQASIIGGLVKAAEDKTSSSLEEKVDELLEGVQGRFAKVAVIHNYVAENINTIHWPLNDFEFTPRPAAEIYESGYGHALDKAVLLCAMLRHAGFDCAIAAGMRTVKGGIDPSLVPCMAQMKRVVVRVEMGQHPLWLDPTAKLEKRSQRDFVVFKGLPLIPGFGELHTLTFEGPNELSVSLDAKAESDLSLEGKVLFSFSGQYSPFYEVRAGEGSQKAFSGRLLKELLPGAEMLSSSVQRLDPARTLLSISFKRPAPKTTETVKALVMAIPAGSCLSGINEPYLQARVLPLVLAWPGTERVKIDIRLPKDVKPFYLPGEISVKNAAGALSQTWAEEDGVIRGAWKLDLPNRVVEPDNYGAFRELYGLAHAEAGRTILFK